LSHIAKSHAALESLWDDGGSGYFSREFTSNRLIKQPSIASLMPLYGGSVTRERAAQLVKLLKDRAGFGLDYPIPSVPADSEWFNPNRYWQGPTWVNTNWFIIDGLRRYGFNVEANSLTASTLNLVNKSGFYEYFDPLSGAAHGANNFSWTAALTIDLVYRFDVPK
jgi:glycogen debranching enzyme